jgi:hypothetical protein
MPPIISYAAQRDSDAQACALFATSFGKFPTSGHRLMYREITSCASDVACRQPSGEATARQIVLYSALTGEHEPAAGMSGKFTSSAPSGSESILFRSGAFDLTILCPRQSLLVSVIYLPLIYGRCYSTGPACTSRLKI